jgi:hypothetical protein
MQGGPQPRFVLSEAAAIAGVVEVMDEPGCRKLRCKGMVELGALKDVRKYIGLRPAVEIGIGSTDESRPRLLPELVLRQVRRLGHGCSYAAIRIGCG